MSFIKREKAEWLAAHATELWEYDATSPSCLRWKRNLGSRARIGSVAGCLDNNGRYVVGASGTQYFTYHIIWTLHYGLIPPEREIDHIDINASNNRLENLRLVTRSENNKNIRIKGEIPYRGVSKYFSKYRAFLRADGKMKYLGSFNTSEEAARAWDREAAKQGRTDLNFGDSLQ